MKTSLLIVEDDLLLSDCLKEFLSSEVDVIHQSYNGAEALEVLASEDVHLVITDINMPVMNGIELIKTMRLKKMVHPIIFFTAHGDEKLMREALSYGAFDFILKPSQDLLEDALKRGIVEGMKIFSNKTEDNLDSALDEMKKIFG
jgi:YesN/AraC family two-component response regulator